VHGTSFSLQRQRPARMPGTLGMTPHEFVGVELRGIAGQEMEREFVMGAGHVVLTAEMD